MNYSITQAYERNGFRAVPSTVWELKTNISEPCPILYLAARVARCLQNGSAGEYAWGHVAASVIF